MVAFSLYIHLTVNQVWRRGWDSNPWLFRVTGFQDQLLKPLGHLSVVNDMYHIIFREKCQQKSGICF